MAFLQRSNISVEKLSMIEKTSALWSASWSEAWIMKLNVDESDLDYRPAVHSETPSWIHLFLSSLYLEKHFNGWSPYAWWKLVVYKWEGKYQGVKQFTKKELLKGSFTIIRRYFDQKYVIWSKKYFQVNDPFNTGKENEKVFV